MLFSFRTFGWFVASREPAPPTRDLLDDEHQWQTDRDHEEDDQNDDGVEEFAGQERAPIAIRAPCLIVAAVAIVAAALLAARPCP